MRAVLLVALVACYSPNAPVGLPCAANGACPSGQVCVADRCVAPGTVADDAAVPDSILVDGRLDAAPNVSGCADGEREAFASTAKFPKIAGCTASWSGMPSMRATKAGPACGDDLGPCTVPAAACAPGWHLCGASGAVSELAAIDVNDCHSAAASGRFLAAMSHCADNVSVCDYQATLPCYEQGWCSEAVCCGADCYNGVGCPDGVWPQETRTFANDDKGCGAQPSAQDLGVLCCMD